MIVAAEPFLASASEEAIAALAGHWLTRPPGVFHDDGEEYGGVLRIEQATKTGDHVELVARPPVGGYGGAVRRLSAAIVRNEFIADRRELAEAVVAERNAACERQRELDEAHAAASLRQAAESRLRLARMVAGAAIDTTPPLGDGVIADLLGDNVFALPGEGVRLVDRDWAPDTMHAEHAALSGAGRTVFTVARTTATVATIPDDPSRRYLDAVRYQLDGVDGDWPCDLFLPTARS